MGILSPAQQHEKETLCDNAQAATNSGSSMLHT
jgi:hypothetical protein